MKLLMKTGLLSIATTMLMVPSIVRGGQSEMSDGVLVVKANMPEEVRVNESFDYQLEVTNSSSNVNLHDIKLRQRPGSGFEIESVSSQEQSSKDGESSEQDSQDSSGQQNKNVIKIDNLGPGESKTVSVTASVTKQGTLKNCLEVASYRPAVCLMIKATKPELSITKKAPERANRCDMIELKYTVKNDGTGNVGTFQVVDSLGEGLQTIDGANELSFDVDGLESGQSRSFLGRVFATETGSFSSRAIAKADNSDLKARSDQTTTNVVAPNLEVKVDGPKSVLFGQPAVFTAMVQNTGNAPARDIDVDIVFPEGATLLSVSDPEMVSGQSNSQASGNSKNSGKQPTMAANKGNDKSGEKNSEASSKMSNEMFEIGKLNAGQAAKFEYILRPNGLDVIPTKVKAMFICQVDEAADDAAKARDKVVSMAMAKAKVVRLPALQLIALDSTDPVPVDGSTMYNIRVLNEGNAPDQNVKIVAELPKGLTYEDSDGPTKGNNSGQTVTFEPVDELGPGQSVEYKVKAKNAGGKQGNVTFNVKLSSDNRDEINEEEPTTLFGG